MKQHTPESNPTPHQQASDKVGAKRSSKRKVILALVVLIAGSIAGHKWWYLRDHVTTDDAQLEAHVLPVVPRVSGFVKHVYVEDEQAVHAGDTLFTLDPSELEIKVMQSESDFQAALAAAHGGVAGAGLQQAESQKIAAVANLAAAQADLDRATKNVNRIRDLAQKDIASKAQLDEAEGAFQAAQARLQGATQQVQGSGFGAVGASAQIRLADARVLAARAALNAAKLQLSYTVVIASQDGHIAKKNLEVGQLLSPNQPVMSIVMDKRIWVVANLKETQMENVVVGLPVVIDIDAISGRSFQGKVRSIQYATGSRFSLLPPDNASGNFTKVVQRIPVRIDLDSAEVQGAHLVPGMSVSVAINVSQSGNH